MTTYNEKTYRVDDIDWDCNPSSCFPYKGGECTYLDYYEKVRLRLIFYLFFSKSHQCAF